MTLIPIQTGQTWEGRANTSESLKLQNLIEAREIFEELEYELRKSKQVMQFYKDAAVHLKYSASTVQDNLGIIRNYPEAKLKYWIDENKLGFDHIANANWVQNVKKSKYYGNASGLLDDVINLGRTEGNEPMTVDEMVSFALGEKKQSPPEISWKMSLSKFLRKVMLEVPESWSIQRKKDFKAKIADLEEFINGDDSVA